MFKRKPYVTSARLSHIAYMIPDANSLAVKGESSEKCGACGGRGIERVPWHHSSCRATYAHGIRRRGGAKEAEYTRGKTCIGSILNAHGHSAATVP
eukprot:scaffold21361_cov27-Tisochrysis_lutea.AAC.2